MILAAVGVAVLVSVMVLKCEHTARCACEKCYSDCLKTPEGQIKTSIPNQKTGFSAKLPLRSKQLIMNASAATCECGTLGCSTPSVVVIVSVVIRGAVVIGGDCAPPLRKPARRARVDLYAGVGRQRGGGHAHVRQRAAYAELLLPARRRHRDFGA